jgi:hypothetical protein
MMNEHRNLRFFVRLGLVLAIPGSLFAQGIPNKTLVVNGKTVEAAVRQIDGHSYVDVETIAQLTNGTFIVDPHQVVLTIPVANTSTAAASTAAKPAAKSTAATGTESATPPAVASAPVTLGAPTTAVALPATTVSPVANIAPAEPPGISRGFAAQAIGALADMREWRGATSAMITHGLALGDAWAESYHVRVQEGLHQAQLAALTDSDRSALQLLQSESDNLTTWWNGVLAARQDLNGATTIDPDALKNDTALAKITACSQFLNSMLVSGTFTDNASCH